MPLSPVGVRPLVSGRPDFRELSARAREGWTLSVLTGLRFSRWKTSGTEFCQRSARAREKRTVLDGAAALGPEFSSRSARARARETDGLGPGRTSVRHGFRCSTGVGRRRLFGALRAGLCRCFRRRRRSRTQAARGWSLRAPSVGFLPHRRHVARLHFADFAVP